MGHIDYTHAYDHATQMWLDTGVEPPWYQVWDDGYNVTDHPVSTWPKDCQRYYAEGWRPLSGPNADPPSEPGRRPPSMRDRYASTPEGSSSTSAH